MLIERIEDSPSFEGTEGLLALVFRYSPIEVHDELTRGVNAYTDAEDPLQVLAINYPTGHKIPLHSHNIFSRTTYQSQEAIIVLKGLVNCIIYNSNRHHIKTIVLAQHDIIVLLGGGHSFEMLQDSVLLEFKNGPHQSVHDKTIWMLKHD